MTSSRPSPSPAPQRNIPPRHRRPQSSPHTAQMFTPSTPHFSQYAQPPQQALYDTNTQIYYSTSNSNSAASAVAPALSHHSHSPAAEMVDDEPYLIYSTSGSGSSSDVSYTASRSLERRSSADSLYSTASSSSLSSVSSLSSSAYTHQPLPQQHHGKQRTSIPSSVPFPSSSPSRSSGSASPSLSLLKSSLHSAMSPVPQALPSPGKRTHSRVPSLDSIKEEEEI